MRGGESDVGVRVRLYIGVYGKGGVTSVARVCDADYLVGWQDSSRT